jgi:hypothetical protein
MNTTSEQKYQTAKLMEEVQARSGVQFDGCIKGPQWLREKLTGRGTFGFMQNYAESIVSFLYNDVCNYSRKGFTIFIDGFNPDVRMMDGFDYRMVLSHSMAYMACLSVIDTDPTIGTSTVLQKVEFNSLIGDILNFDRNSMIMDKCTNFEILIISNVSVSSLKTLLLSKNENKKLEIDETRVERVKLFFGDMMNRRKSKGKMTIVTLLSDYASVNMEDTKEFFGYVFSEMIDSLANGSNNFSEGFCNDHKCCRIYIPSDAKKAAQVGLVVSKTNYEDEFKTALNALSIAGDEAASIVKSVKEACKNTKFLSADTKAKHVDISSVFKNLTDDVQKFTSLNHGINHKKLCEFLQKNADMMVALRSERYNGN